MSQKVLIPRPSTPRAFACGLLVVALPILASAQSADNLFAVRQSEGRTVFDLPASLFGKDLLWYVERSQVSAEVPEGAGQGSASMMIRLERRDGVVLIRNLTPSITRRAARSPLGPPMPTSDDKVPPMVRAVAESALAPPLAALPIAAGSTAERVTVDVTDLFRANLPEFKLAEVFGPVQVDASRTFIDQVRTFPRNVQLSVLTTAVPLRGGNTLAAVLNHSWVLLPEKPMRPRFTDPRVGLFSVDFELYDAQSNLGQMTRGFVRRYRLEKRDPSAPVSEPVQPIVYYVDRTVPEKWRPYVRQGIEDWQPAFEAAGFKRAIIARDAPTEREDPDWNPSDSRHSVIRWIANPVANAVGPNLADPRTGEILSAHILIWEDVLKIASAWYYTMCSALDPRANTWPLSDELTGRMMRYIVAHEVGHTLGLRHNHRASTAYTVAQLRDPKFAAEHGSVASIMAYGRMNYVAQPGDGLTPESLMPRIAPYDFHAIKWSYAPLPAETEAATLAEWAALSHRNDWLVFGGEDLAAMVDPRVQMQNIGVERVAATRLGMANLKIAMRNLPAAYARGGATSFDGLYDAWAAILRARQDYLSSVLKEIGGREEVRGDISVRPRYRPVPAARQSEALDYILTEGIRMDPVFYPAEVLDNGVPFNVVQDVRDRQRAILLGLFDPLRINLLSDGALRPGAAETIPLDEYFERIARAVFSEAESGDAPDMLRRALQRDFFSVIKTLDQANPTFTSQLYQSVGAPDFVVLGLSDSRGTDAQSAMRMVLKRLETRLARAVERSGEGPMAAHWNECLALARRSSTP